MVPAVSTVPTSVPLELNTSKFWVARPMPSRFPPEILNTGGPGKTGAGKVAQPSCGKSSGVV